MPETKPEYTKPRIVASYSKEELKEEFKELKGQTSFSDGFTDAFVLDMGGMYGGPDIGDFIGKAIDKLRFPFL